MAGSRRRIPPLTRYGNRSGDSGVVAYALEPEAIVVQFQGGATYRYGARRPGAPHVEAMKQRALAGRGLSGYISQHARDYEARLR